MIRGDFLAESIVSGRNSLVLFYSTECDRCSDVNAKWTEVMKTWGWEKDQAALYKMACNIDAGAVCAFHHAVSLPVIKYFKPGFLEGKEFTGRDKVADFANELTACNVATHDYCDEEQIAYIKDLRSSARKLRGVKELYVQTNEVVQKALFDPNNDTGLRNEEWARASWELPLLYGVVANPEVVSKKIPEL